MTTRGVAVLLGAVLIAGCAPYPIESGREQRTTGSPSEPATAPQVTPPAASAPAPSPAPSPAPQAATPVGEQPPGPCRAADLNLEGTGDDHYLVPPTGTDPTADRGVWVSTRRLRNVTTRTCTLQGRLSVELVGAASVTEQLPGPTPLFTLEPWEHVSFSLRVDTCGVAPEFKPMLLRVPGDQAPVRGAGAEPSNIVCAPTKFGLTPIGTVL